MLQHAATSGNSCRRIVALEKVAGSSPVGHPPKESPSKSGTETSNRGPRTWLRGPSNAIGNAMQRGSGSLVGGYGPLAWILGGPLLPLVLTSPCALDRIAPGTLVGYDGCLGKVVSR